MEQAKFDMEVEYRIDGKVEVTKIENIGFADIQKHIPASAQVVGAIAKRVDRDERTTES